MIVHPRADGRDGWTVQAPAKLNLFLEILGKRTDGFHELETLMVATDLCDTIAVAEEPSGLITLECDDPSLPTGPSNLVMKAAEALRAEAGVERGAAITLSKVIPAEAGLAGGSSDAAATLLALDRLWNLQTSKHRLEALAGRIGSDVAFFLNLPAAVCRGRGERVEPIELPEPLHCVVIRPPWGLSTAEVYRHATLPEHPRPVAPVLAALASGDRKALGRLLFNRLQEAALRVRPELGRILDALANPALSPFLDAHLLSGSGSACFGLARDLEAAQLAARQLENLGPGTVRVVTCRPQHDDSPTA
jgi:4-diphosphocytidyl-2-C-methyl-D-erythritol kinase